MIPLLDALTAAAARRIAIRVASSIREGRLAVRFPDGSRRVFGQPGAQSVASLRIDDDDLFRRVVLYGEIGFGEAYVDGLWTATISSRCLSSVSRTAGTRPLIRAGSGPHHG